MSRRVEILSVGLGTGVFPMTPGDQSRQCIGVPGGHLNRSQGAQGQRHIPVTLTSQMSIKKDVPTG